MGIQSDCYTNQAGDGAPNFPYGLKQTSRIKSLGDASYTVLDNDGYDTFSATSTLTADRTVTLPTAAENLGRSIEFYRTDTADFHLYIEGEGSETLSGRTRLSLKGAGHCKLICDGTLWLVKDFYYKAAYSPSLAGGPQVSAQSIANSFLYVYLDYVKWKFDYTRTVGSVNNDSYSIFNFSGQPFTFDSGGGYGMEVSLGGSSTHNYWRNSNAQIRVGGTASGTRTVLSEVLCPITWT